MGAANGKKRAYNIDHESKHRLNREVKSRPDSVPRKPGHALHPLDQSDDENQIKPQKLKNPIIESRSHQELHKELLSNCRSVEKSELQRLLESRKRDQLIRQRKQEEEAHRRISPLEAELLRRYQKQEKYEQQQQDELTAPEFVKVRENLRRTSLEKNPS